MVSFSFGRWSVGFYGRCGRWTVSNVVGVFAFYWSVAFIFENGLFLFLEIFIKNMQFMYTRIYFI